MIFCIEDDAGIREIEVYTLRSTGFEAEGLADGAALAAALKETQPELLLLDVMLPGQDGVAILKKLRENPSTRTLPVIMATARGTEYDKIVGLDLGADDYLVKPFGMMEMVARVKAVLRRTASAKEKSPLLSVGGLLMNTAEHTVAVNGSRVPLTLKEYELLELFLTHPGMVFTRDQLLTDLWGTDYDGETRTVDVHIRTLRQKLGDSADLIETVRGVGYRMEVTAP